VRPTGDVLLRDERASETLPEDFARLGQCVQPGQDSAQGRPSAALVERLPDGVRSRAIFPVRTRPQGAAGMGSTTAAPSAAAGAARISCMQELIPYNRAEQIYCKLYLHNH